MYNKLKKGLVFAAITLLCYSCSVDEGGPTGPEGAGKVLEGIEARIDSLPWKAFNYSAYLCGRQLTLTAQDSARGTITITLNDTVAGKTYDLNISSAHWATYTPNNSTDIYTTFSHLYAGGTVLLSDFNKDSMIVSGSFIFYAYNLRTKKTVTISEGAFSNVSYTNESYPASGMRAYIGGKLWTATTSQGNITDEYISIQGENTKGEQLYFRICNRIKDSYALNINTCNVARYVASSTDTLPFYSNSSGVIDGKLVISDITADSLVSGSFITTLYRVNDKKTILVSQGLFNRIKLKP